MSRNSGSAKAKNRPDGAKAFHIATDMEDKLLKMSRLFSIAIMLAESTGDEAVSDAFAHIGSTGEDLVDEIKAMRDQISHLTWGYQYGRNDAGTNLLADRDTAVNQKAA